MTEINQRLYDVSLNLLTESHVPVPLADAVSRIVATDNPELPYSGRNLIDNELAQQVLPYLNKDDH